MAVSVDFLKEIKKDSGITATYYDSQVMRLIEASRLELIRVGVSSSIVTDESNILVTQAVSVYVHSNFAEDENEAARLTESFNSMKAALSLSTGYMTEAVT